MEDFSPLVLKMLVVTEKKYRFNYLDLYSDYVRKLTAKNKKLMFETIKTNSEHISTNMMKDIANILSYDITNKSVKITSDKIENYIRFSIYNCLLDLKMNKTVMCEKLFIEVQYKSRVDTYTGYVYNLDGNFMTKVNCKYLNPLFPTLKKKIDVLKENNLPLPLCGINNDILFYENCRKINTDKDDFFDVMKDLVNQLNQINKYYFFDFINPNAIGKTRIGNLNRYFIWEIEFLKDKGEKSQSHNPLNSKNEDIQVSNSSQIIDAILSMGVIYGKRGFEPQKYIKILNDICSDIENDIDEKGELDPGEEFLEYLMS
jgi:hypothetical protein